MTVHDRSHLRGLAELLREVKAEIRDERVRQGKTQDDMAELTGSNQSTYAAWEADHRRRDSLVSSIFRAANALDLDVEIRLVPRQRQR